MATTERRNLFLFVLGLIVAIVGWEIGPGSVPAPSTNIGRGHLVFPGLAAKLPGLTRITIESGGKSISLLPRTNGAPKGAAAGEWGLEQRGGYPVRTDKLRSMLTGLTLLRQVSPRTSDPALYSKLGVENAGSPGGSSTQVTLFAANGKVVASLIVGHTRVRTAGSLPDQVYIRRPGHKQSWLAQGTLSVDANPQLWLRRTILDIPGANIASVTSTRNGTALVFTAKAGKLHLTSPAKHPKLDRYKVSDIQGALTALTLQDVAPAATVPGKPVGTSEFRTTGGLTITVHGFRQGANFWAQFAASGKGASPLEARLHGWSYKLGSWMERELVPDLAELKAAAPAAPAAIPPATAPATPIPHAKAPGAPIPHANAPAAPGTAAPGKPPATSGKASAQPTAKPARAAAAGTADPAEVAAAAAAVLAASSGK